MSRPRHPGLTTFVAGLLLTVANTVWAAQAEEAQRWLERMTNAVKTLNYQGTFVYNHQGRLETMRLIHRADEHGEQERLYSLTGVPREIIRDNEKVTCILPEDRAVRIDWRQSSNPFAEVIPADIEPLREHYRFELQGKGRVADRSGQVIAILPRDQYRYGYRLWIDTESGLLLRSDLLNETGETLEQLLFTRLETVDVIPDEWLQPAISGDNFVRYQLERDRLGPKPATSTWHAANPPGYELRAHRLQYLPGRAKQVEHLLFSDGLASVSVYIEQTDAEHAFSGVSRVGAVSAFGRWLEGTQFTVVGEVPVKTVERIGKSLRPMPDDERPQ